MSGMILEHELAKIGQGRGKSSNRGSAEVDRRRTGLGRGDWRCWQERQAIGNGNGQGVTCEGSKGSIRKISKGSSDIIVQVLVGGVSCCIRGDVDFVVATIES